jgi:hypothetical protein
LCKILNPDYGGASNARKCPCGFFEPQLHHSWTKHFPNCYQTQGVRQVITLGSGRFGFDQVYPHSSPFFGVSGAQIFGTLTIIGAGAGKTIISGHGVGRLFQTGPGGKLTLRGLTLTEGKPVRDKEDGHGGALYCRGDKTTCTLEHIEVSANGGCCGGGIKLGSDREREDTTLFLNNVHFKHNFLTHMELRCLPSWNEYSGGVGGFPVQ